MEMNPRITLQPAYVLHRRPFRNTSLLVDLFTLDFGLIRAVAKGARRQKSRSRALLQLFQPLLVSVSGKGEVKTLTSVESNVSALRLQGVRLLSGLYVNELLSRLLQNQEEHAGLYESYRETLVALQGTSELEPVLRRFEMSLLAELGYAINLEHDCETDLPIVAESLYRFIPDLGFLQASILSAGAASGPDEFRGADLIALREMEFADDQAALAAKRLLRLALSAYLGDKPLHSRGLFAVSF
ncbi:MAG: DNA repair protein RecO [Pseudomonadota bacterium]|jgi:DNA repair protein RecO (recombination protein O)|nr:DNA repair protein RecO [Pseudomonadota bacterium]